MTYFSVIDLEENRFLILEKIPYGIEMFAADLQ